MDAKTLFDKKLPEMIKTSPNKAKELEAIYLFKIKGDNGGVWTVDLKSDSPGVSKGDKGNADCTIELADSDFEAMLKNSQLAMQLFFQGKLKVTGNPMLATKLQQLFELV
ncbi:MAG: SCP2 sterol-binding domain-containing protein [Pseudomonadota bacterium]